MAKPHHTQPKCKPWKGRPSEYQDEAYETLVYEGINPSHWAWITPICGTEMCLQADHLICNAPIHLQYPDGVCIYCGRPADTKDHLLPRGYTGDAARHFTAVVPACRWCNTSLGARLTWSITERRAMVREIIRKKYRTILRTNDFSPSELDEFGPNLRADIEASLRAKRQVLEMLEWPEDPAYDVRALEQSGIENGYEIGLLIVDDFTLQQHVHARLSKSDRPDWAGPEFIEPRHLMVKVDGIVTVRRTGRRVGIVSPDGYGKLWAEDMDGAAKCVDSRKDALRYLAKRANRKEQAA